MMLSDKRILEEKEKENLVIEPYDERCLGTNSYDVHLGQWYYAPQTKLLRVVDFMDEFQANTFWGNPKDALNPVNRSMKGKIIISPGTTILAHTEEVIGGTNGFTTMMKARSSTARSGISIVRDAGLGDSNYISKWTMEICNHNQIPVILHVGMRIGQMVFFEIGETLQTYSGKYGSRYEWDPSDMLGKFYKDWDVLHVKNLANAS